MISAVFEDTIERRSFLFQEPLDEVIAQSLDGVIPAFEKLESYRQQGFYLAGYVSYDAGFAFFPQSECSRKQVPYSLLHFGVFQQKKAITVELSAESQEAAVYDFSFDTTQEEYIQQQKQIRDLLWSGDIYQLNQTFQAKFRADLEPQTLYNQLKRLQPTHYSAFLKFTDSHILSLSPELFYKKQGSKITTQPMKGTLALGENPQKLLEDKKAIAENLMIVDLLRNDLGRIAHPGTVTVEKLFEVHPLSTLQQMTSTISAQVAVDLPVTNIFASLFPCGSITGAPKWSAMKEISQLENSPRGVYTGALGFIEPNNDHCFNVAIRTIVAVDQKMSMGLGGGIVADSDVFHEFKEAHLKSRFVRQFNCSFSLFETMLFDGKKIKSLQDHLTRLEESALFYNFELNRENILQGLDYKIQNLQGLHKIKLQLSWDGNFEITSSLLQESLSAPRVTLSPLKVNSKNHFQMHKTSCRKIYDEEWKRIQDLGFYDVLFLNENGELVEASRHNVFLRINQVWITPPLSAGALPGIERKKAIQELSAREQVLTVADLQTTQEVMLTNSVRGQVPVRWVKP